MKSRTGASTVLVATLLTLGAKKEEPKAEPELAEHVFKNIQVFKGTDASELIPAMNFIAGSLGVQCEHCHVTTEKGPWPLEKDDKPAKQAARKMILMVREINDKNFDGTNKVTCASCHNGHQEPRPIPPFPTPGEGSEKKETGTTPPSPAQLLDAYETALGGRAALVGLKSRVLKGKLEADGKTFGLEVVQASDRISIRASGPEGEFGVGYDGSEGWRLGTGGVFSMREGIELSKLRRDADLNGDLKISETFPEMKYGGRAMIGSTNAIVLRLDTKKKIKERLFFDPESHLLLRRLVLTETLLGPLPEQTDFSDYRTVGGLKIPFRVEERDVRGTEVQTFDDVKTNVAVDAKTFAKPEVATPKPK
jgi:hypothetical protein